MILTLQKTIDESCVSFFENLFFLNYQEKMVFPFWNWASSRKSSWTFPLPIRENRLTRPVSTSLTLERWALSDEFQRPINCCATRSTAHWSRARWAILSNTGKWTRNETLYDQHLNLFQITKNLKLVSFSPPLVGRLAPDRSGYVKLRFNPSNVEDSEARLAFLIFTNTTSQELEPQGDILVYANVVKRAEISIKGYNLFLK